MGRLIILIALLLLPMTNKRVRHVPVVDGGELKGMVSIGDIVKNQLDEAQLEIDTMRDFARTH